MWIQTPYDDPTLKKADWQQIVAEQANAYIGHLECTLDGNPVTPIIRAKSPGIFTVNNFTNDNIFAVWGLTAADLNGDPIVSDGFWVLLPPLAPGTHVLHFSAGTTAPPGQDVTYNLTVLP